MTQSMADSYLNAFKNAVNNGGGQARIEFYAGNPQSGGTQIAVALLDTANPFGANSTSGNYRQCSPTPEGGNADLTVLGLAAAGAGTNCTHWQLKAESGQILEGGTARGVSDPDNGEQAVLSNKNIAEGQSVTVTGFTKRVLMLLGNI